MVTTPTPWQASTQVNTASAGFQGLPDILGLSNGNYLVVFEDNSDTVGTGAGSDIVGVMYDAIGNIVRPTFQVNTFRTIDDEGFPSIAATNDGGFIMVYKDTDIFGESLHAQRYDSEGNSIDSVVVQDNDGIHSLISASIAVNQNDNSFLVTFGFKDNNLGTIQSKKFDSDLNYVSPGLSPNGIVVRSDDRPTQFSSPSLIDDATVALSNGNYVTVFSESDTSQGIEFRISLANGNNSTKFNIQGTGTNSVADYLPNAAALSDGGFVVTWIRFESTQDRDVMFARFNESGTMLGSVTKATDTTKAYAFPNVIGLEDGGFFIVAENVTDERIEGTRYDSSGELVGSKFFNLDSSNNPRKPQLDLSSDGRILLTWTDAATNDIYQQIWDPRGTTIIADGDEGQITARATDDTIIIGSGSDEHIYGRDGDDDIQGGFGNDSLDGGSGFNTVNYSYDPVPNGLIFLAGTRTINLSTGESYLSSILISAPRTDVDTLANFQNVIGSGHRDIITGTNQNNTLNGAEGNDTINGLNGDDSLNGGDGNDTLSGGFGNDILNGGSGIDTVSYSYDPVPGGLSVFAGTRTINLDSGESFLSPILIGSPKTDVDILAHFQNVIGSGHNDIIIGTDQNNVLGGGGSNDILEGQGSNDILNGDDGNDTLRGGSGNDELYGDAGDDQIFGGKGRDFLSGGKGADTIVGGDGGDSIFGNHGNDFIDAGRGADKIDGGTGLDRVWYGASSGGVTVDLNIGKGTRNDAADDTYTDVERVTGSDFADSVVGNNLANSIKTGSGDDIVFGRAGRDVLEGQAGKDSLFGGADDDNLLGGTENDKLFGNSGFDSLHGGLGNDQLTGGGNSDTFVFETEGASGFGADVVFDFQDGFDKLDVSGVHSTSNPTDKADQFSDFTVTTYSGGVRITFEAGQVINLDDAATGITAADIDASDFIFA